MSMWFWRTQAWSQTLKVSGLSRNTYGGRPAVESVFSPSSKKTFTSRSLRLASLVLVPFSRYRQRNLCMIPMDAIVVDPTASDFIRAVGRVAISTSFANGTFANGNTANFANITLGMKRVTAAKCINKFTAIIPSICSPVIVIVARFDVVATSGLIKIINGRNFFS